MLTHEEAERTIIEHEGCAKMDERNPAWDHNREETSRWEVVLFDKTRRGIGKTGYGETLPEAVENALRQLPVKPL